MSQTTVTPDPPWVAAGHAEGYRRLEVPAGSRRGITLWLGGQGLDPYWDAVLEATPLGQFQQSSAWGEAKAGDGWRSHRFLQEASGSLASGFQVLWKGSRFGRIGYVSKGPVAFRRDDASWAVAVDALIHAAHWLRLRALLVQPPDEAVDAEQLLMAVGFQRERVRDVIDASLWFDLSGDESRILARMPGYNRTFIRQAERRGVRVREGGGADLALFHDLMLRTCVRQEARPNPASLEALKRVWEAFERRGALRLTFAEAGGEVIAALTSIRFGGRMTLWKKGWKDGTSRLRPNHLLYFEALCQAQRAGCAFCDFYSVRRDIAQTLIEGGKLTEEQSACRDRFHLGFGGVPKLLPRSFIYFPSRVVRRLYPLGSVVLGALSRRGLRAGG